MPKICLIEPPYNVFMEELDPPFPLMYLAAVAEECGWQAEILDMKTLDDRLPEADVYGATSTSPQWPTTRILGFRLQQQFPEKLKIIGGTHISACPEDFDKSMFNIAVLGEGEKALTNILSNADTLIDSQGTWKTCVMNGDPITEMDTVPFPARHLIDWTQYKRGIYWGKELLTPAVSIISARGCPFHCCFCGSHIVFGRRVRFRSIENIVAEIKHVIATMGYRGFNFHDDSVAWDQTIPILEKGEVKLVPIGATIDSLLLVNSRNEFGRDVREFDGDDLQVFSFDCDYKIKPVAVRKIIRHRSGKSIFRVVLSSRRQVRVSEDHSVFTIKNGEVLSAKVSELAIGDWVVIPKRINFPENKLEIDTTSFNSSSRLQKKIKNPLKLSEDLCWFMGLFLGDGCLSPDGVAFTVHPGSLELANKARHVLHENVGCNGKLLHGYNAVKFYSKATWLLLDKVFNMKRLSKNKRGSKRVAPLFFTLPKSHQIAFLKGYIEAEGHFHKGDKCFEIACGYEPLVEDIMYLLLNVQENAKVYKTYHKVKRWHGYKIKLLITSLDMLGTGGSFDRTRPHFTFANRATILRNLPTNHRWQSEKRGLNFTAKTVKKALARTNEKEPDYDITADKVVQIEKMPAEKYLYDIEVDHKNGHDNFIGGLGGICLHNTFCVNKNRVLAMCAEFEKLDIVWRCLSRVDTLDGNVLKAMRNAGCKEIILGVESGNQQVLDRLEKGTTVKQNLKAMKLTKASGIQLKVGIIVGSPGETWQTVRDTEKLLKQCPPDYWNVSVLTPFPGSPIWACPEKYGIKILTRDLAQYAMVGRDHKGNVCVETEEMSKTDIEQARDELIDFCTEVSPLGAS